MKSLEGQYYVLSTHIVNYQVIMSSYGDAVEMKHNLKGSTYVFIISCLFEQMTGDYDLVLVRKCIFWANYTFNQSTIVCYCSGSFLSLA